MSDRKPLWRDAASVITAFIVVVSFIMIGFFDLIAQAIFNKTHVEIDEGWMAAMLSLASAAFGYLVGKRKSDERSSFSDRPLCESCPIRSYVRRVSD